MTLTQLISKINYNLRGTDDTAPVVGDDDWIYWTSVANSKKDEMYDDAKQNWASSFDPSQSIGTIAAATLPSFPLPLTFISPSDEAIVVDTNSQYHYYDVVKPQERDRTRRKVYISGRNPATLYFTNAIIAGDQIIGGTLYLPGSYRPADIDVTAANAYVPVDDPNWLAMAVAAEIAFNDITYQDKFGDLSGKGNVLYHNMTRKNRRGSYASPRVSPTRVKRITGFRR